MAEKKDDSGLTTITPIGTFCFTHVWEPFKFPTKGSKDREKEPEYRTMLVFDEDVDLKAGTKKADGTKMASLKSIVQQAILKKWGKEEGIRLIKKGKLSLPWRDADDYEKYGAPFVEGNTMISAHTKSAPGVVNAKGKAIANHNDFYPGCRGRISVYAHAYDTLGNMGVTLLLNNVQKTGDGERISGRMPAEDEFDAVESNDDGDMESLF